MRLAVCSPVMIDQLSTAVSVLQCFGEGTRCYRLFPDSLVSEAAVSCVNQEGAGHVCDTYKKAHV